MASNMALLLVANLVLFAAMASATTCPLTDLTSLKGCNGPDALCTTTLKGLPNPPLQAAPCLCAAIKDKILVLNSVNSILGPVAFIIQLLASLLIAPLEAILCSI